MMDDDDEVREERRELRRDAWRRLASLHNSTKIQSRLRALFVTDICGCRCITR